jgi:UDP-N-acetylmuramyl pentapeptide synthase
VKLAEKVTLFHRTSGIIAPSMDGLLGQVSAGAGPKATWTLIGHNEPATAVNITGTSVSGDSCLVDLQYLGEPLQFRVPFSDQASISNAVTCIAVLLHMGRDDAWINERIALLEPVDMRLRTMQGRHW